MFGDYVKINGQLARIENEAHGLATVKVLKTRQIRTVYLTNLHPVRLKGIQHTGQSSSGRTPAFDSGNLGSNPS